MTMAPISRDIDRFIVLLLLVPSTGVRRSLERNLARLGTRKRGRKFLIWRDKRSGPLPPALLTNAFANPLEVCAAGAIIMTLATFVCNLRHFVVLRCVCPSWTTAGR